MRASAIGLFDEALQAGAARKPAASALGLSVRTLERWRAQGGGDDRRRGPVNPPRNKLTDEERRRVIETVNRPELRDLSPRQIVPKLADQDEYVASESTIYRVLRDEGQMAHRQSSRPPRTRPRALLAERPNQVWSWDITYLTSAVRGRFYYLYLVLDIWSRKVVGWAVHEEESAEHAARLVERAAADEGVRRDQLTLHSDNGSPMKGATMLATLQWLGITPSLSRPSVKDDNPYSEAIFRTAKYRPEYPGHPFADVDEARRWVAGFVQWYNHEHLHSAIRYVTPVDRHDGRDTAQLRRREQVYERARRAHPERWTGDTRDWSPIEQVHLNPDSREPLHGNSRDAA